MPTGSDTAGELQKNPRTPSWQRAGAAVVVALCTALLYNLAMPGLSAPDAPGLASLNSWWPLLFFCLVPLLLLVPQLRPAQAAGAGFFFGLVVHGSQLLWILIVLGRYGGLPLWLSIPALFLLAAYMALYSALFCLFLSWLLNGATSYPHPGTRTFIRLWAPPLLWTGLDALRGVLFTGFPWMDLGYGLFRQPQLLLSADLGGHHLLTFVLVLINAAFTLLVVVAWRRQPLLLRTALPSLAAAGCLLLALGIYSLLRSVETSSEMAAATQIKVGVVQGNIEQDAKWTENMKNATVERYLRLSRSLTKETAELDVLVWPETALPFYPQDDPLASRVAAFAASGTRLLTGAPLYRIEENQAGRTVHHYNGALLFGTDGKVDGVYNKQHLVPFGEYVPLRHILFFLEPLAVSIDDFTPGRAKGPLTSGNLHLGVLICYESIFPTIARDTTALGANVLVNITNDAWYGRSKAPVQSLAMAVLRAVENRRALVRSANTGISGFIDPLGRTSEESAIFTEAAAVASMPLMQSRTVFTRIGHRFGLLCALLILPLILPQFLRQLAKNGKTPPLGKVPAKKVARS